jgi:hypothetical protein
MSGIALGSRLLFASALAGVCTLGAVGSARAQTDEQRAGARTLATEGAHAFNEGRFKDAVDLFGKAESLLHAPPHLLFMARANAKLGQLVRAREAYLKIVKEELAPGAPQAFRDAQTAAGDELKQLEPKLARLLIKVDGAEQVKDLSVTVDGQAFATVLLGVAQPMDPGAHTVVASAPGYKAPPASVTLKEAERAAVTLRLEPDGSALAAPPVAAAPTGGAVLSTPALQPPADVAVGERSGLRIGSYVGFGVGAAGIALGTVFVLKSASKRKQADDAAQECNSCEKGSQIAQRIDGLDDDARSAQTLGIVGYVVGGVGVAAGVTLLVLSQSKDEPKAAYVAPYVGLGAVGVRGAF